MRLHILFNGLMAHLSLLHVLRGLLNHRMLSHIFFCGLADVFDIVSILVHDVILFAAFFSLTVLHAFVLFTGLFRLMMFRDFSSRCRVCCLGGPNLQLRIKRDTDDFAFAVFGGFVRPISSGGHILLHVHFNARLQSGREVIWPQLSLPTRSQRHCWIPLILINLVHVLHHGLRPITFCLVDLLALFIFLPNCVLHLLHHILPSSFLNVHYNLLPL
mmetsp:Transcript_61485/g.121685  ORF Transcript_61485/g.121685 Transcript_61485/m.121685 type:complete len:216 (-) Transcript_61485:119-766(-)